jgi:two-component sensor histidine kinase
MVFHELATNAAKYGALSQPDGQLRVQWSVEGQFTHSGPSVIFGLLPVERGVEAELGGRSSLGFAPSGVTCGINVPWNGR